MLEDLGWTILRVWSTDWFRHSLDVAGRLHDRLKQLLEEDRKVRAALEEEADEQTTEAELPGGFSDEPELAQLGRSELEHDQVVEEKGVATDAQEELRPQIADLGEVSGAVLSTDSESNSGDVATPIAAAPIFQAGPSVAPGSPSAEEVASAHQDDVTADPDRFFDSDYAPVLRRLIRRIVEREEPLTVHGLAHRVAQEHGWQRTGRCIQEQVQTNLSSMERHSEFGTVFVWAPATHADRVPFRGLNGRQIRDVSRTEIASVIDANARVLANAEDSILVLSRLLGIARLSKDARAYLSECARWREENAIERTS